MRLGESGERHARVVDAHDEWISRRVDLEQLRRSHLRHQADIGDSFTSFFVVVGA
jgi:hypothetical protein